MDPFQFLKIKLNPDGTLTRLRPLPAVPTSQVNSSPTGSGSNSEEAASKDIPLNLSYQTFLRLFKPQQDAIDKLPLIIYFHGGGFVLYSAAARPFHRFCAHMAAQLRALVVSVEYRLAPEHRLPAAYDDAIEAITWVRNQALAINGGDSWLTEYADFSRCFLMGNSAGANVVYHSALRALDFDFSPLKIQGLIMIQPYFGGVQRTRSELELIGDRILPLPANDLLWALALPEGSDRDHEYCNPMAFPSHHKKIRRLQRCFVSGCVGDPLLDRQREFSKMLANAGVTLLAHFEGEGFHGVELFVLSKADSLINQIRNFIISCSSLQGNSCSSLQGNFMAAKI